MNWQSGTWQREQFGGLAKRRNSKLKNTQSRSSNLRGAKHRNLFKSLQATHSVCSLPLQVCPSGSSVAQCSQGSPTWCVPRTDFDLPWNSFTRDGAVNTVAGIGGRHEYVISWLEVAKTIIIIMMFACAPCLVRETSATHPPGALHRFMATID